MNDPLRFSDRSCSTSLPAAGATTSARASSRNHMQLFWLAMPMSAAALLVPTEASGQRCLGNSNIGCLTSGAVCSPVDVGVGPSGH